MASALNTVVPRVFISHRHRDKVIADALRKWIEETTNENVAVFQSSHPGSGLNVGEPITRSICEKLLQTSVLILVYTHAEQDWSWCMFECGRATDPAGVETRIVVLECTGNVPALFAGQLSVKAGSRDSVEQFAIQFLTDPTFFPGLGRSIADRLNAGGDTIKRHAQALYRGINEAIPDHFRTVSDPWPAWPYLSLAMPCPPQAAEGLNAPIRPPARSDSASRNIENECFVDFADKLLCQRFGLVRIEERTPLSRLPELLEPSGNQRPAWLLALEEQLQSASEGRFPTVDWENCPTLRDRHGKQLLPLLCYVKTMAYEGLIYFDVYFLPVPRPRRGQATAALSAAAVFLLGAAAGAALLWLVR